MPGTVTEPNDERFVGLSSDELLRRAQVLLEVAKRETIYESVLLEKLAHAHEAAARHILSGGLL